MVHESGPHRLFAIDQLPSLRGFSCWDQYLVTAFAQLSYRESLPEIEACLRSMQGKL
jgi:hypothetical protein